MMRMKMGRKAGRNRLNKKIRGPLYFAIILLVALFSLIELPGRWEPGLTFRALDVGQGDSFLFHLPDGENILVDAGTRKTGAELVDKLRRLGVKRIDILVATHPHEDHIGGMTAVINAFPIVKIWDSGYNHGSATQKAMLEAVKEKNIRFGKPKAGFREEIGGVAIEVLGPDAPISGSSSDANNNSLIIRVVYGDVSFLMMADVEGPGRERIKKFPGCTVLKVSHHGSHNGTDDRLMRQAAPEIAVLSYGRDNSYGHPHKKVLDLLKKYGIRTYSTVDGDVIINTDGTTYTVRQER